MTNMEHALVAAGVKVPSQKQRIWTWLKDNGAHSTKDLASELKIGEPTVQAAITDLVHRKMLRTIERTDHKGTRILNHYEALGRAFELIPLPKKGAAAAKRVPPEVVDTPAPSFSPEKCVEHLTLIQAKQVYQFLGRMFK